MVVGGWGGELEVSLLTGLLTGTTLLSPRCVRAAALWLWLGQGSTLGKETGCGVRGADASLSLRGIPIFSQLALPLLPMSVSASTPFHPPLVTSLLGMSKCKMQKPGTTTWPKTSSGRRPRQFSHSDPPRGVTGRVSRRSGLRVSLSRQVRPAWALSAGS